MQPFLDQLVAELQEEYGQALSDFCLVVPTRRAVVFLRDALARAYQQTLWAPHIVAIQDYVRELDGRNFPDPLVLIYELYLIYQRHLQKGDPLAGEPFERFYAWGEMLIRDFDEVDKYCVPAQQLFTNVKELKEIEDFFEGDDDHRRLVRQFWQTLRGRESEPSELQQKFLRIWQMLANVYADYRQALAAKHLAYDGMAYRDLAEGLEAGTRQVPFPCTVFIGFNALSKAEEHIMRHLLREQRAMVYWDVDLAYFTPPESQRSRWRSQGHIAGEAPGQFIKDYHQQWQGMESRLVEHDMVGEGKDIFLTGVPRLVGQAQYLGNRLEARLSPNPEALKRTVIVLADEGLLFPVLYALPAAYQQANITMGYPLKQSHLFHLLITLTQLLQNQEEDPATGKPAFSHREVLALLGNPYLKSVFPHPCQALSEQITAQNMIKVPQAFLLGQEGLPEALILLFSLPPTLKELPGYFGRVFDTLYALTQERKERLEAEYVFYLFRPFNQFREMLRQYPLDLSRAGFARLFRDVLQRARIPFEGEPLEGLQIMGFLETRVLDFERVFILAANEGNLPDTSTNNSFIPYHLRKGFGLPTYEEKDSIYAYHFFRLLQRAKEVELVYNTEVSSTGGANEVSRFIRQIRHFFQDQPHIRLHEQVVSSPAPYALPNEITIEPEPALLAQLQGRFFDPAHPKYYFSPSALTTYLRCPLRFYFQYLARIRETEEIEESMEARTFGSVFHEAMEALYAPLKGQLLTPELLVAQKDRITGCLKQAFEKLELDWNLQVRGPNHLYRHTLQRLIERVIEADMESEPFRIEYLEERAGFDRIMVVGPKEVKLSGTLDRVDFLPEKNLYRILDYKTGKVEISKKDGMEKAWEDPVKHSVMLQGMFYALLFRHHHPEAAVQVGFYQLGKMSAGAQFLENGQAVSGEALQAFQQQLTATLQALQAGHFPQTEDETRCRTCPYQEICNRG